MVEIRVGVVDVYVIRPYRDEWLVLSLQRSAPDEMPGIVGNRARANRAE